MSMVFTLSVFLFIGRYIGIYIGIKLSVGGGDFETSNDRNKCIPFVSEYSDCTDENRCTGCQKCICIGPDKWSCETVTDCPGDNDLKYVDDDSFDHALYTIQNELEEQENAEAATRQPIYVPGPTERSDDDLLLDSGRSIDERIRALLRNKRSVENQTNHTVAGVKFYHTVDELNEDTLKSGNLSGTLQAQKKKALASPTKPFRRTGVLPTDTLSQTSLHIEHNQPKVYDHHITDNKIDAAVQIDEKFDKITNKKINIFGNQTQKQKDRDLSKLIVNELKPGTEVIGDKKAPIMSNITFTPENDTLTAMAFIAGNLLNKLWNMEKDSDENSKEAEVLKHEKIADLLDLFKEPLNLRQENFLKGALEQLSEAVNKDKDLKNISLCEEIKLNQKNSNNSILDKGIGCKKEAQTESEKLNEKKDIVTSDTISKVNNVLSLINKFQGVHKNLMDLKKPHTENQENIKSLRTTGKSDDAQEEYESLTVFGKILAKITKLLMPPKKSKKVLKSIKNQNVFTNNQDVVRTLKDIYNIDIDNSSLTTKDKIVFDYLNSANRNPKCIFESLRENNMKSISRIEGDILLNLSEFFKVKSFVDLMNLLEPEKRKLAARSSDKTTPLNQLIVGTKTTTSTEFSTTVISTPEFSSTELPNKLLRTKEKLKAHLKTIIDDLIELQKAKGQPAKNISIVDALPCIFNMLNSDKFSENKLPNKNQKKISQIEKVTAIFESIKKDLQTAPTRRTNSVTDIRPKSAAVWERVITNLDNKSKQKTRRTMGGFLKPKNFDEIKKKIDELESTSKSYKAVALIHGVPPSERQIIMKIFAQEVKDYIKALEDIYDSLYNLKDLSIDHRNDLNDFVENADKNINLNRKIIINMNRLKKDDASVNTKEKPVNKNYVQQAPLMKLVDSRPNERNNIKLSRDIIINQLIKNRMQLYVKIKESKGADLTNDFNYDLAKKILTYLDKGSYNLARELYKVVVSQKDIMGDTAVDRIAVPPVKEQQTRLTKEPLVQFEQPKKQFQWLGQEAWLKQLQNLKNLRS